MRECEQGGPRGVCWKMINQWVHGGKLCRVSFLCKCSLKYSLSTLWLLCDYSVYVGRRYSGSTHKYSVKLLCSLQVAFSLFFAGEKACLNRTKGGLLQQGQREERCTLYEYVPYTSRSFSLRSTIMGGRNNVRQSVTRELWGHWLAKRTDNPSNVAARLREETTT